MKQFLAVFTGHPTSFEKWMSMDEATRKAREEAGMKAWNDWQVRNAARITVDGGPLGRTKRVTAEGIADTRNHLGGFVVIKAESQDEAARLFEGHPHFTMFPGDGVEVMEIMPIPGAPQ